MRTMWRPCKVVTFGEAMVRLTPPGNERLERTASLNLHIGGAELNSAVTLSCLEVPATWVSRCPTRLSAGPSPVALVPPESNVRGRLDAGERRPRRYLLPGGGQPILGRRRSTTTAPAARSPAWRRARSTGRAFSAARAPCSSPASRPRSVQGPEPRRWLPFAPPTPPAFPSPSISTTGRSSGANRTPAPASSRSCPSSTSSSPPAAGSRPSSISPAITPPC